MLIFFFFFLMHTSVEDCSVLNNKITFGQEVNPDIDINAALQFRCQTRDNEQDGTENNSPNKLPPQYPTH